MRVRFLFFLCFLCACANQVAPTGGDKDIIPPKPVKIIPENFSTNFHRKEIAIFFDEFIQLKDVTSQLIVCPPLKYPVKTKVKGKQLQIEISDTLQPNTTYTFNFGGSIVDLREGNAIENFQYVFSTGDVIDSLIVEGKVENAFDKKTEKGILVMLYRGNVDSLSLTTLPDYFARTNDSGLFQVRNVSPLNFKIFSLKDANSNYLYDSKDETIAFSDSLVEAGAKNMNLSMFKETPKQQLLKSFSDEPGKAVLVYSQALQEPIRFLSDTSSLRLYSTTYSKNNDTITFWLRNQTADSLNLLIGKDTISVRLRKAEAKGKFKYTPVLSTQYPPNSETAIDLNQFIDLTFNHPIEIFALENISITEDTIPIKPKIHFIDSLKRVLHIEHSWKEKIKYNIFLPPGSLTDIFGTKNDTLKYFFKTKSIIDYGTVLLHLQISEAGTCIVQLVDEKDNVIRQTQFAADTTISYEYLDPKTYRLKIIFDTNKNGKWDTGNYSSHQQPELVTYYPEPVTVRANWDVDLKWIIAK